MTDIEIDPADVEVDNECFHAWWVYHGLLADIDDVNVVTGETMRTKIFGFETVSDPTECVGTVPPGGTAYGYVVTGMATVHDQLNPDDPWRLRARRWFCMPDGCKLNLFENTRVVVSQRVGFKGLRAVGGPIEAAGRLKYIDRCSDTLLVCPPLLGDPCFNHLHFPPGIEQTEHTHPSTRAGAVARGLGWCETPHGLSALRPGLIFHIPTDGRHRFVTSGDTMDVIAYHPDSDWGPTDAEHPMVNRTWVDGEKIDNTSGVHTQADVIGR